MRGLVSSCFALSLLLACGTTSPAAVPADDGSSAAPEPSAPCQELGEKACLDSPTCTLVQEDGARRGYRCREASPPCETGFLQGSSTAGECSAKAGCVFDPGHCYCPPDVVCVCGGGPPPGCVAEGSPGSGETTDPSP